MPARLRARARGGERAAAMAAAALLTACALLAASCGGPARRPGAAAGPPSAHRRPPAARGASAAAGAVTEVATLRFNAIRYLSPGHRAPGYLPASWYQRPSVLPVIAARPGWVRVRVAQRPNGSTAWLPVRDVALGSTPYRIVIDLVSTRLKLYDRGRLVFAAPAGVGARDDPTPAGKFFVAFDEPPPRADPGYGPFIMVTSAHSPTIADWAGSGDALIGIHGPIGADSEIGATGARISHGCVRLHDQALARLRQVPPGTPIDIIG